MAPNSDDGIYRATLNKVDHANIRDLRRFTPFYGTFFTIYGILRLYLFGNKSTGTLFLHSKTSSTEDFVYELVILCDTILHCMLKQKIHDVMPASFTL